MIKFVFLGLELTDFKARRITAFRKNLIELTELEIKHAKVKKFKIKQKLLNSFFNYMNFIDFQGHADLLKKCLDVLREE